MSKKLWFILIVFCIAIAILALSRFVAGFDAGANNMVIQPAITGVTSVVSIVQANPVWLAYGHWISLAFGVGLTAFTALVLWPKVVTKMPQKDLTGLQKEVRSSTPQTIPTAPVQETIPAKTVVPKAEPKVAEEVKPKA